MSTTDAARPVPDAHDTPTPTPTSAGAPTPARTLPARAAGAVVGAAALGLLSFSGVLPGPLLIAVLVLAALAIPSAQRLAGRVLRMVPILSALAFLTWMVPVRQMPHGDLIAAAIGGALGYWVTRLASERNLRRLLPRVDIVDLIAVPGVATVATINLKHMVLAPTASAAADFFALQWDNSSHSFIDVAMRHNGTLIRFLPLAPDGTQYSFTEYPAAYHASAEAFMTYLLGHGTATASDELLAWVRATGGLGVLGAVVAACAVASLIGVRRNQLTAALGAGMAGSVMIAGPGALGLVDGHYNFPFTLSMVMVAMSTVISMPRVWNPWRFSLLIAAVTCAAGSWLPMGVLAGVMALAIALPLERRRWSGTPLGIRTCLGVGVLGAAVSAVQAWWVIQAVPASMADAVGGISRVVASQFTFALVGVVAGVAWSIWRGGRRGLRLGIRMRHGIVGSALLGLCGIYAAMAYGQWVEFGQVRYYAAKLQDGFVDLALVYLAMTLALVGAAWPAADRLGPVDRVTPARKRPAARVVAAGAGIMAMFTWGLPTVGPITGDDKPPTPASLATQIKARPEFQRATVEASALKPDQYAVIALLPGTGSALQDTVLVASLRGTYSEGTSQLLLRMLNSKQDRTADLGPTLAPDLVSGKAVIIATPAIAADLRLADPTLPAWSIKTV